MQGLHYIVTVRSRAAANRIVIDGFSGEGYTKAIFKIDVRRSSTFNFIGVLHWKILSDYLTQDPAFVVRPPPQLNPQAAAPPQVNLLGGGVNPFLDYLESLV